ncbi:RagB/SusD family nutrient uptake outer membrane protein [uncultured Chitinophaga sp.]|uniref:RagB/SusD family nutrient uptake outer membrane protein n=1 Tax=uncultured Chitinophaga sp. TaxID=339340 RepID=UPI0025DB2DEB|nr:RagB/SusD family nutrient uptake outer membrane protein [uncultured Chitinophaga sp.]
MLKHIFNITALALGGSMLLASCAKKDFLDARQTEALTEDIVFADSAQTLAFLNNAYAFTGQDIIPMRYTFIITPTGNDYASLEDLTTHSVSFYSDPQATFIQAASTPKNYHSNRYYTTYYAKIRALNQYMKKVGGTPLSPAMQVKTTAEARFLRAFYYAQLVRYYGGVKMVGDTVYGITDDVKVIRNTFKDCIDYIATECDKAAVDLPNAGEQQPSDYGHITKGMCLALKARMLVHAASPLYNGSPAVDEPGLTPLIAYSASYDANLWKKAADACKAVMDLNQYSLYEDNTTRAGHGFWKVFLLRKNSEYIYPYMIAAGTALESARFPVTRSTGGGYSTPTQNLVEAFGMANGKPITDPSSGYDANNPYNRRDPRFYYSIIHNGATVFYNSTKKMDPVDIYKNAATGVVTYDGLQSYRTRTGYYARKMANDSIAPGTNQSRVYPIIRYAEILLGYAEALNEFSGATQDVYDQVIAIRKRAGILPGTDNLYGLKNGMTKEEMRAVIRNEREVEFAYEGHWYYDTRRWKTAEVTENVPIRGMMVTRQTNGTYTYTSQTVINAVFSKPKMYFSPFSEDEVNKSSTLIQNPGW